MGKTTVNIIDLSHLITPSMPVYPGTEPPRIDDGCTIAEHGFAEKRLTFFSHTGTHIDAPGHILVGAARLDDFAAGQFIGSGCALDVSACRGRCIEVVDLEADERRIAAAEFVLLHTGWGKHWGEPDYFGSYPVLSAAAAHWLTLFDLKGIGVDAISVDEMNSTAMTVHRILFARNLLVIENLVGLDVLLRLRFLFSCLPLKLADGDGSPVRAIATIEPREADAREVT